MICAHCGAENVNGAKNCYKCGQPLAGEPQRTEGWSSEGSSAKEESILKETPAEKLPLEETAPPKKHKVLRWLGSTAITLAIAAAIFYGWVLPNYYPSRIWEGGASGDVQKQAEEFLESYLPAGSFSVYGNAAFDSSYVTDYVWLGDSDLQRAALELMGAENPDLAMAYRFQTIWTVSNSDRSETLGFITADTTLVMCLERYMAFSDFTMDSDLAAYAQAGAARGKQTALEEKISLEEYRLEYVDGYSGGYTRFIVYYQWTNTTGKPTSPSWDISLEAYQNGVAMDTDYAYDQPYGATDKILPGQTVTNTKAFKLNDNYTDVTVIASEFLSSLQENPAQITVTVTLE